MFSTHKNALTHPNYFDSLVGIGLGLSLWAPLSENTSRADNLRMLRERLNSNNLDTDKYSLKSDWVNVVEHVGSAYKKELDNVKRSEKAANASNNGAEHREQNFVVV